MMSIFLDMKVWRLFARSEGKANPCWRAPPDRGCEFQDVPSVKEPLIVMYRIRPCHKMIPICQDSDARGVVVRSRCCLVNSVTTFSPSPILHKKLWLFACAMRARDLLSYNQTISSQTRAGRTRVTFPGVSVSATDRWSYDTHTADRKSTT